MSFADRRGRGKLKHLAMQAGNRCALCDRTAIYRVGAKAYCAKHKTDAAKHQKRTEYGRTYYYDRTVHLGPDDEWGD